MADWTEWFPKLQQEDGLFRKNADKRILREFFSTLIRAWKENHYANKWDKREASGRFFHAPEFLSNKNLDLFLIIYPSYQLTSTHPDLQF